MRFAVPMRRVDMNRSSYCTGAPLDVHSEQRGNAVLWRMPCLDATVLPPS